MPRRPSSRHRRDVDRCISTQEPAAKKKPTPPDQDGEPELTGAEKKALSEAAYELDAATSTASAIQRKAEEILGLNHRSKLLEEALALSWPAPAADVSATRGVSPQGAPPTSPSTVTIHHYLVSCT